MATHSEDRSAQVRPTSSPSAHSHPRANAASQTTQPQPSSDHSDTTEEAKPTYLAPRTEFLLDWTIKVLGVASAILFGIWAPISYKATADGNADNNASQDSVMSSLSALSIQATKAATLQSSAASGIDELQSLLSGLATLSVWNFCEGKANSLSVCSELSVSVRIEAVIASLAGITTTTSDGAFTSSTQNPTASPTSTTVPGSAASSAPGSGVSAGKPSAKIGLAATLGIVFGVLAFVGLLLGILLSRRRISHLSKEGI